MKHTKIEQKCIHNENFIEKFGYFSHNNAASNSLNLHSTVVPRGYSDRIQLPYLSELNLKNPPNMGYSRRNQEECGDDLEGVQSKKRWTYLKVNMDGVIVGRKICLVDVAGFSCLALQLEDMFGMLRS